jgi:hypothetical protein
METSKKIVGAIGIVAVIVIVAAIVVYPKLVVTLPNDGADPKPAHYENLNRVRFIEIFVVGGNGITGNMLINVYNTIGAPGFDPKTNKDSSPQAWVEGVKTDEIKKQFDSLGAAINGPKLLMLDWMDLPNGVKQDFNGKKVPWVGLLHLTKDEVKELGKFHYKPTTIERKSKFGINKGTLAFLIDDANGNTWVMKGFQQGMKPAYTFEEFAADASSRFKMLPPGWKVRTKVLDQDLVLVPETGIAAIMPDEFFNVYDRTGPGYSNYKP